MFCLALLFARDSLFGGAGIGKRLAGLRVVQTKDGRTPLGYGQGVVRWLSQFIPIFNLVDAVAPYYDPLLRRYGDRWAGTRVLDSDRKLAKDRYKLARRLIKKGVQPPSAGWDDHGGPCSDCLTIEARKLSALCEGRGSSPLIATTRFTSSAATSWRARGASSLRERRYWAASEIASSGIAASCAAGRGSSDSSGAGRSERSDSVSTGS